MENVDDNQGKTPQQVEYSEQVAFWCLVTIFAVYVTYLFFSLFKNLV
jgi:hypothetical protein